MGLFKKKQKIPQGDKRQRTTFSMPEFPKYEPSLPELPKYDFNAETTEQEPMKYPEEPLKKYPSFPQIPPDLGIPKRVSPKMGMTPLTEPYPRMFDEFESRTLDKESSRPEGAIFVRIEEYKKSIENLRHIKGLLKDAEKVLEEIQTLKQEEDRQISGWHQEITEIKTKLLEIDKDLFEYK